jgi:ABC-type dipeptide/oligopeptide/nickel transport system permease component
LPPLLELILVRIGLGIITLQLVSVVVFAATQALPGDTARAILGREAANTASIHTGVAAENYLAMGRAGLEHEAYPV